MTRSTTSAIEKQYAAAKRIDMDNMKIGAVLPSSNMIVGLNRKQMRTGVTSQNKPIKPKYSRGYAKMKLEMGSFKAPYGTPDLFVTGAFQNAMFFQTSGTKYALYSRDSKTGDLYHRYPAIFGLTEESKRPVKVKVTNLFIKNIHVALNRR
jgi:hypothetical protein